MVTHCGFGGEGLPSSVADYLAVAARLWRPRDLLGQQRMWTVHAPETWVWVARSFVRWERPVGQRKLGVAGFGGGDARCARPAALPVLDFFSDSISARLQ